MNKIIRIGTIKEFNSRGTAQVDADIFCNIEMVDGRLSITGVVGPKSNGDCLGSAGQIVMSLKDETKDITPAPGWTPSMIAQFFSMWGEWHLNDMQAGSPAQTAELAKHTFPGYPANNYDWSKEILTSAGLQPDPSYIHNGKPYSYGSAWLRVEVPPAVLAFLESLPDADKTPAWV